MMESKNPKELPGWVQQALKEAVNAAIDAKEYDLLLEVGQELVESMGRSAFKRQYLKEDIERI